MLNIFNIYTLRILFKFRGSNVNSMNLSEVELIL